MKVERKTDNDELKHDVYAKEFRSNGTKKNKNTKYDTKTISNKIKYAEKTIKDIESGKAIYNAGHYSRIKRVLKIT